MDNCNLTNHIATMLIQFSSQFQSTSSRRRSRWLNVSQRCHYLTVIGALSLLISDAQAQSPLPNPAQTPGALNPAVTQQTISDTICVRGWTATVRPPWQFTSSLKRRQLAALGYADQHMRDYEEDHLIPLELGGAPADPRNLWPEPREAIEGWRADQKDALERVLNRMVCNSMLPLAEAQHAIAADWPAAYRRFAPHE